MEKKQMMYTEWVEQKWKVYKAEKGMKMMEAYIEIIENMSKHKFNTIETSYLKSLT